MKTIYLLAKCNDKKEISSFITLCVTTSKRKIMQEIKKHIESGLFSVSNQDLYEHLVKAFVSPVLFAHEFNMILKNGYLQTWCD